VATKLKVLFFDIETAPLLAYVWQAKTEYVSHDAMVNDSFMLSWAAKWQGSKAVEADFLTPEEVAAQDDHRIVTSLADMIRAADIVVAHNGDGFDIPMLNNRLLALGEEPVQPVKTIDTCKLAKKSFRLAYNKLDYLGEYLGLGKKLQTDFNLWKKIYVGDQRKYKDGLSPMAYMVKYNRKDVVLLEAVYDKLVPYVKGLPRLVEPDFNGEHVCPTCGHDHLIKRGLAYSNASTWQTWQCMECLRYSKTPAANKARLALRPL